MTEARDQLLLINEAISIAIHEIEEALEGLVEQVLALGRKIGVLADLGELALEEVSERLHAEITMKLDLAH